MPPRINILIADDEKLFRDGLKSMLAEHQIFVTATADDGEQALVQLSRSKHDVVLLDLEMPVLNGSQALDRICKRFPGTRVVIVSSYYDKQLIRDHFNRGARAYVSKREDVNTVVAAIRNVYAGKVYMENIPELLKTKAVRDRHYYKMLFTKREQEIIRLLCVAKDMKSVAAELFISEKTVEAHLTGIYKKVKVKNKSEFLVYALREGLEFLGQPVPRGNA